MGLAAAQGDIPEAIRDMNARLGLPSGLAAMGVTEDLFDDIITAPWPTTATRPTRAQCREYPAPSTLSRKFCGIHYVRTHHQG
jgi:alcohol dehydrogenase class IV